MRRVVPSLLAVAAVYLFAGSSIAQAPVSTGGDPHAVTAQQLRDRLAGSGLRARLVELPDARVETVAGVVRRPDARLGFEFQVYPASDVSSVRMLGKLRAGDFGLSRKLATEPFPRGVLGNVAYSQYGFKPRRGGRWRGTRTYLRLNKAERQLRRKLDDVLFGSFPTDDSFVHPLSSTP